MKKPSRPVIRVPLALASPDTRRASEEHPSAVRSERKISDLSQKSFDRLLNLYIPEENRALFLFECVVDPRRR